MREPGRRQACRRSTPARLRVAADAGPEQDRPADRPCPAARPPLRDVHPARRFHLLPFTSSGQGYDYMDMAADAGGTERPIF
jgi:hypothetical protein